MPAFEYKPDDTDGFRMDDAAFIGIAAEFVDVFSPHRECSGESLLAHFITYFGSMMGMSASAHAASQLHHTNIFVNVIGATAKVRKGTARRACEQVFAEVEPDFKKNNIQRGLQSGEGLIKRVRDADPEYDETGTDNAKSKLDAGVTDKRLLCIEEEFSSPLKRMKNQTNTLSEILRRAWDSDPLDNLTKNDTHSSSDHHISAIGHSTVKELEKTMADVDAENGFFNRFLWIYATRHALDPQGARFPPGFTNLIDRTTFAMSRARESYHPDEPIGFDSEASKAWGENRNDRGYYWDLEQEHLGLSPLVDSVLARGSAHVLRLSLLYAVMDGATSIELVHLDAAMAFWRYSERSVMKIFGGSGGYPLAEKIYDLASRIGSPISKEEINRGLGGNYVSRDIGAAMDYLVAGGRASLAKAEPTGTSGRPPVYLQLTEKTN